MSMIDRIRNRRIINREHRAIDRALRSAPTQSMRDEIAIFSQQRRPDHLLIDAASDGPPGSPGGPSSFRSGQLPTKDRPLP